jgi:hypothetical protein
VFLYVLLGALFISTAPIGLRKRGVRFLFLSTLSTVVVLLIAGLWDWHTQAPMETDLGMYILLALVSPGLAAIAILGLARAKSPLWAQWGLATLAWAGGFLATAIVAVALEWISF